MERSLSRRRAILALFWGTTALGAGVWAISASSFNSEQVQLGVAFTVVASLLTRWSSLDTSRIEYDPAGTFVVGTAIAVGPAAAPLILFAQAVVMGVTDGAAKRRHPFHVISNIGLMAAWHGFLAFLTGPVFATAAGSIIRFIVGMTVVAALTTVFNYLTVAVSAMYLYGSEAAPPTGGTDQLIDIGLAVIMGTAVWISSAWGPATLAVLIFTPVYGSMMIRAARERAASLALEIAARVDAAESRGPLPGHSGRVNELVSALLTEHHPRLDRATLAAWIHGPMSHSYDHRCSGVRYDDHLPTSIRSIPRSRRIESVVPADGIPGNDEISQLVAAACAWDSRRLAGSPIRTPDDLIYTFGIDRDIVERVIELDPGWEIPQPHRPSGTSRRG